MLETACELIHYVIVIMAAVCESHVISQTLQLSLDTVILFFYRKGLRTTFDLQLDLDLYQIIFMLMKSAPFWFGMFVTIVVAVLPDILGTIICRQIIPSNIQKAQVCR